jgi:hypothetical protein
VVGLRCAERVDPVIKPPIGLGPPDLVEKGFELALQVWWMVAPIAVANW